ncbi:hypothetical protein [Aquimarina muelleri]|uniref:Uncharacterized protein n=1 Tax=Aquimarina muelleri TaxID=279356 RepID=A0A918JU19_9FLAO|nr:hypothetical protein [Aquimarina muelleri]MCX2763554.1 hypothetical protein [Aquimarina muelleri]GGX14343.1 hypothetical protein GCM10007384_14870 [Aquimarina muelleri]
MKKILFITISLFLINNINSQDKKKYMPFMHNNLWGIVDSTQKTIIEPKYNDIRFLGELDYVSLDDKLIFDLEKGTQQKSPGTFETEVFISKQRFYLFNNNNKSILIDLKNNEKISLSLKYTNFENITLTNPNSGIENEYIIGTLDYDSYILLKNTKKLPAAITGRFSEPDLLVDKSSKKNIFFTAIKNSKIYVYNTNLKIVNTFLNEEKLRENLENLAKKTNSDGLSQKCFTCAEIMHSGSFDENPLLPEIFEVSYKSNRLSVVYKNKEGKEIEVNPYQTFEKGCGYLDGVTFGKNLIFIDFRYVKPKKLMFPKEYLD